MSYELIIEKSAQRALNKIPQPYQDRLIEAIRRMRSNPRTKGTRKLSGRDAWRIRVGDYRIIYEIDDDQSRLLVVVVGHRREAYKIGR